MALFVIVGGAIGQAAEATSESAAFRLAPPSVIANLNAQPALQPVTVWDGVDLDGDGAKDFANPTGGEARGHDAFGSGQFGASRDGGERRHEGVDYIAEAGQAVVAPISGYVTKIGYAYDNDRRLKFVEITNPALHYAARTFYVNPGVAEGDTVLIGQAIGRAETLQGRYAGITDHVHLELIDKAGRRVDAARVITSRVEMEPAEG